MNSLSSTLDADDKSSGSPACAQPSLHFSFHTLRTLYRHNASTSRLAEGFLLLGFSQQETGKGKLLKGCFWFIATWNESLQFG